MNKIDVVQEVGFPIDKKYTDTMQSIYNEAVKNLAKTYGDNVILWGCELSGSVRTAGAVVINGEVLPFKQSTNNAKIKIIESAENAVYGGGETYPAYYTRYVQCDSTGTINLIDLKRISIRNKPAETNWQNCVWQSGVPTHPDNWMQAKIDNIGRCLVRGMFFTTEAEAVLPIAKIPFTVTERTYIQVFSDGQHGVMTGELSLKGGGYIDTDSIIYIDTSRVGTFQNFMAVVNFDTNIKW